MPQPVQRDVQNGPQQATEAARTYRFERFSTALLIDDMRFRAGAPRPGDRVPSFSLPTLDGGRFDSHDLGPLPVLMVFGSRTCPITESAGPLLRTLHAEFAGRVRFVLVNTREAIPATSSPSHDPTGRSGRTPRNCAPTTASPSRWPSMTSTGSFTVP